MKRFAAALLALGLTACASPDKIETAASSLPPAKASDPGVFATLVTSRGDIIVKLFSAEAPLTVKNFVELSTRKKRPFYDGTRFFRVIPGFMIQGGDPKNDGTGGPGYAFADEFHPGRKFDRPGLLAMASSVPDGGGSQFFITLATASWLDKKHTIFGEVVEGMRVVEAIGAADRREDDRPVQPQILRQVRIEEK